MKKIFSVLIIVLIIASVVAIPAGATYVEYKYGDVTKDDIVDVVDATVIQRHVAGVSQLKSINLKLADFDNDKEVSVLDSTNIQRYSVGLTDDPRGNDNYLEFFVDIKDVEIESYYGDELLANKAILFTLKFDDTYFASNENGLKCEYTFTGVTDPTYKSTYSSYKVSPISWSFPSEGVYEYHVKFSTMYCKEVYTFSKQFVVNKAFEFDNKRFVDYNHLTNSPHSYGDAPSDATSVDYEMVLDTKSIPGGYGMSFVSDRFVALVHTREEYNKLFECDNKYFDDEFFKTKSLVVSVAQGYDEYDYSKINDISMKDNTLYVQISYGNSYPDPNIAHPTAPAWYSFASVDKADVENIEIVQRVK